MVLSASFDELGVDYFWRIEQIDVGTRVPLRKIDVGTRVRSARPIPATNCYILGPIPFWILIINTTEYHKNPNRS